MLICTEGLERCRRSFLLRADVHWGSMRVHRFLMVPQTEMKQDLRSQEKELTDDINSLTKKVCSGSFCCRIHADLDVL